MKRIGFCLKAAVLMAMGLMFAGCSDTIVFPAAKQPPVSKTITAAPYLMKGIYVCPMPLPSAKPDPKDAAANANVSAPQTQSNQDLSKFLCNQGVVIYYEGDTPHMVVPSDIIFFSNSSSLRYQVEPVLDSIATLIKRSASNNVTISAYTDVILPTQQGLALSKAQAKGIETYFWGQGISMQCMNAEGYGSGILISSAWTQPGNAANRRIEIVF